MITIDAMGCQTKIAKKIVDKGGNDLLAVKRNQPNLHKALTNVFNAKCLAENATEVLSVFQKIR